MGGLGSFFGEDNPQSDDMMKDVAKGLRKGLPIAQQAIGEGLEPMEQYLLDAQGNIEPQRIDLLEKLYTQLNSEGGLAEQGRDFNRTEREFSAQTDLDLLQGVGGDRARAAQQLMDELNPEQASARRQAGISAEQLLQSLDPNKLSGGELAETERFVNRSNVSGGVADSGSNTAAIKNALQFSDRLQARRAQLGSALGTVMPGINSLGTNAFQGGSSGLINNQGISQFQGLQNGPVGQNTMGISGMLTNNNVPVGAKDPSMFQTILGTLQGSAQGAQKGFQSGGVAGGIAGGIAGGANSFARGNAGG